MIIDQLRHNPDEAKAFLDEYLFMIGIDETREFVYFALAYSRLAPKDISKHLRALPQFSRHQARCQWKTAPYGSFVSVWY